MIYFWIYIALITLVTFVLFGVDKYKARTQRRRISEKFLYQLTALGGGLGAILGMEVFRHKTIKSAFLWKFWLIVLVWLVIIGVVLFRSVMK